MYHTDKKIFRMNSTESNGPSFHVLPPKDNDRRFKLERTSSASFSEAFQVRRFEQEIGHGTDGGDEISVDRCAR